MNKDNIYYSFLLKSWGQLTIFLDSFIVIASYIALLFVVIALRFTSIPEVALRGIGVIFGIAMLLVVSSFVLSIKACHLILKEVVQGESVNKKAALVDRLLVCLDWSARVLFFAGVIGVIILLLL